MGKPRPAAATRGAPRKGLRDRRFAISVAAVQLFTEQGLEATTVDDIAAAAGVAPRTFFRHFATKEEAAFPDHDERIEEIRAALAERREASNPVAAVLEVARASAMQYLADPELYRPRFKLVLANAAIRDRERLIDYAYERTMAEYLEAELGNHPAAAMRARAIAAGIVAAVNTALYRWAEAPKRGARRVLDRELRLLEEAFAPMLDAAAPAGVDAITVTVPASVELQLSLARALDRSLSANGADSAD